MFYRILFFCFTFCSFLNEDAFMFSESLTEQYCISRLRISALKIRLFAQRSNRVVNATRKGYKIAQLAKYLVHLPDLLLVLQVDWGVEVGNFVFFCCTLAHNFILTWMHELSQCCKTKTQKRSIINSVRQEENELCIGWLSSELQQPLCFVSFRLNLILRHGQCLHELTNNMFWRTVVLEPVKTASAATSASSASIESASSTPIKPSTASSIKASSSSTPSTSSERHVLPKPECKKKTKGEENHSQQQNTPQDSVVRYTQVTFGGS